MEEEKNVFATGKCSTEVSSTHYLGHYHSCLWSSANCSYSSLHREEAFFLEDKLERKPTALHHPIWGKHGDVNPLVGSNVTLF